MSYVSEPSQRGWGTMSYNDAPWWSQGCDTCDLHGVRVLLVEDELECRLVVARLLEWYGAEVLAVATVDDALDGYGAFEPDVVVTDMTLEVGTGLDLVDELRRRGDSTPVVAMSGFGSRHEAIAHGCQAYLPKPVESRALAEVIRSLLPSVRPL